MSFAPDSAALSREECALKSIFTLAAATLALAASPTLVAQWPRHLPAGVPTGADGKVNLDAPAPRTADGKWS